MNTLQKWLAARWAEPESRAGVAGGMIALVAYVSGQIQLQSLGLAELGAALTFLLPGPLAAQVLGAITKPVIVVPTSAMTPAAAPISGPLVTPHSVLVTPIPDPVPPSQP